MPCSHRSHQFENHTLLHSAMHVWASEWVEEKMICWLRCLMCVFFPPFALHWYLYLHSYHIITYALTFGKCVTIYTHPRERHFNAIINLHISNCCHGTMFSIWFLWYALLIIHEERGRLWFLQYATLNVYIEFSKLYKLGSINVEQIFQLLDKVWEIGIHKKFQFNLNSNSEITMIISNDWVSNLHTRHQTYEYPLV